MRAFLFVAPMPSEGLAYNRLAGCQNELDCLSAEVLPPDPQHGRYLWTVVAYYQADPHITYQDAARRGMRLVTLPHPAAKQAA